MVKFSKSSVSKRVYDFFQKANDKKTIMCPEVLNRVLKYSDARTQCNFGLTCKTALKHFEKNFVIPQELSYFRKDQDAPFSAWTLSIESVTEGFVLRYTGMDSWKMSGHYAVQKVTKKRVQLRRLTNIHKATVGKRKFFISYVYDSEWECKKKFTPNHDHFWDNLYDNWEIIATSEEEYTPLFEAHWDRVMPAWKIKRRGYPKLLL